jgi:pimeloyl-ACP methyl ester carboxylesterase
MNIENIAINFITIDWAGRNVTIEYQWVNEAESVDSPTAPLIVFLHEGLGSRAMWKDFPQQLCKAVGCRGLVYSRPGYGQSTPRAAHEAWGTDFMHRQAYEVLPALLKGLGLSPAIAPPLWLFGHSDGGSIALLFAAKYSAQLAGIIVVAPHILVEDISITNIEKAKVAYETTDLRQRLSRHHTDPDSAFWGWNDIWLHPDFRAWDIGHEIATITCPVLAVQGLDDEYGTLAQIHGIAQSLPQTVLCELTNCGHSPHRDQPAQVVQAVTKFQTRAILTNAPAPLR